MDSVQLRVSHILDWRQAVSKLHEVQCDLSNHVPSAWQSKVPTEDKAPAYKRRTWSCSCKCVGVLISMDTTVSRDPHQSYSVRQSRVKSGDENKWRMLSNNSWYRLMHKSQFLKRISALYYNSERHGIRFYQSRLMLLCWQCPPNCNIPNIPNTPK
jgi:hypothetical protein